MSKLFDKNTLVSVIIPTFNRSSIVLRTLISVLNQSYSNIEVIIVDDGSMDNTEEVLLKLKDKRIKYHKIEHTADIARVRNIGFGFSTGKVIAYCDDDDLWINDKLEKQLPLLDEYDMVCSNARIINDKDEIVESVKTAMSSMNKEIDIRLLLLGNCVITSSVLVKSEIVKNGFNEMGSTHSAEDYELWLRIARYHRIYYLADPLVLFRKHQNTTSYDVGEKYTKLLKEVIRIIDFYREDKDKTVKLYAQLGILRQKRELIKVYLINFQYLKMFFILMGVIRNLLDWDILKYIILKKSRSIHF